MQGKVLEEAKKRKVVEVPSSQEKSGNQAKEQKILSHQQQWCPISDKPQMWSSNLKENLQKVMEVAREMEKSGNLSTASLWQTSKDLRRECVAFRNLTRKAKEIFETDPDKVEATEAYMFWD